MKKIYGVCMVTGWRREREISKKLTPTHTYAIKKQSRPTYDIGTVSYTSHPKSFGNQHRSHSVEVDMCVFWLYDISIFRISVHISPFLFQISQKVTIYN